MSRARRLMAPIHEAVRRRDVVALRRELERGVDPDLRLGDGDSRTALQLLSAGADLPAQTDHPYLQKVIDAGGWEIYRRQHLDQLTAMLTPKDQTDGRRRSRRRLSPLRRVPPEVLRKIVAFAFHAGYY